MKSIFQFREGCHLSGDAQVVGERLEAIRAKQRALTPQSVLKDARNIRSPLHEFFVWDDATAAEKYRLDQAAHLIRSVSVIFEDADAAPERQISLGVAPEPAAVPRAVRAFLSIVDSEGESSYVSTREAMADEEMRRQVLARAHAELNSVARKWRELRELGEVFGALDRVGELLQSSEGQSVAH